jgi:hypothetical protein
LIDLTLLVHGGELERERITSAITATFSRRGTHTPPLQLDPPPAEWFKQFAELSESCLAGAKMSDSFETVKAFYNGIADSKRGTQERH